MILTQNKEDCLRIQQCKDNGRTIENGGNGLNYESDIRRSEAEMRSEYDFSDGIRGTSYED